MADVTNKIKNSLSFLDNPYVSGIVTLIIILFASLAAPKLPHKFSRFFSHNLVKLLFCFLIVYLSVKNVSIAIILSIALIIVLQTANKQSFEEQVRHWTTLSINDHSQRSMDINSNTHTSNMGMQNMDGAVMMDGFSTTPQQMPVDVGYETSAVPENCSGSSGILGSDPDADSYGSI